MTSLREKQKKQRKEAILVAAMNLFDSNGYSSTTIEQIAAAAEVSAPTVYNYLGSKQAILFSLIDRALSDIGPKLEQFDNAIDALYNFQAAIIEHILETLPISTWRELLSLSFDNSISLGLTAINIRITQEITSLLRDLQKHSMITADIDPAAVAELLNDYWSLLFTRFVHQNNPDIAAHSRQIRRVIELTFTGLRP